LTKQKYLFNLLFSQLGQELLKTNITGAAQGGLNSTNLKNIKIPPDSLILTVVRNNVNEIPDGNFIVNKDDRVITIARRESINALEQVFINK